MRKVRGKNKKIISHKIDFFPTLDQTKGQLGYHPSQAQDDNQVGLWPRLGGKSNTCSYRINTVGWVGESKSIRLFLKRPQCSVSVCFHMVF
ncbi:MAG: hypothetical protein A3E83_08315 [Gammaproteobacteria bacterium RIFCSPHIGHO2_12_FULL_41_20]|nr:MAG: hypothetical protein A3E83_08315 [Gammaproteobacteria bacterium RIFCSPHIGHO2_12_FULL_41_20]